MANVTMNVKVVNVVKTTTEWSQVSDVITKGVLCVETTTDNKVKIKVGDGAKTYDALPYASEVDLSDYSTTTQVTQAINDAIAALGNLMTVKGVVTTKDELPAENNKVGDVYFVGEDGDTGDSYAEYVWTEAGKWEYIGQIQTTDLSDYYKKSEVDTLLDNKVDIEAGKGLSANDFTNELKAKLDGIEEEANKYELPTAGKDTLGGVKTTSEVVDVSTGYTAVPIVDGVPYYKNEVGTTVDDALSADSENPVQNKIVKEAIDKKVDAVDGKTLTSNDFTDDLKTKLEGIAEGATAVTVDETLTDNGVNPVQGKAIKTVLDGKVDATDTLILNCTL